MKKRMVFGLSLLLLIFIVVFLFGCAKKPSEIVVQARPLETVTKSLVIKNLADKPVTMPTSTSSGYISIPSAISFGPDEEREIDVLITPEKEGEWTETLTIGENKFKVKIISKGEPAMTQEQYETAKKGASAISISLGEYNLVDKKAHEIFKEEYPEIKKDFQLGYLKFDPNSNVITAMRPSMYPSPEINFELTDDGKIKNITGVLIPSSY